MKLYVANLNEEFLVFECLVLTVISHAEDTDPGLLQLVPLAEHNKLSHEGHMDGLTIQLSGHFGGFGYIAAVHQPKPGRDGGGKADAVINKGEWRGSRHILPLRTGRTPCQSHHTHIMHELLPPK